MENKCFSERKKKKFLEKEAHFIKRSDNVEYRKITYKMFY